MANALALAGPGSRYGEPETDPAGFLAGLWHGLVILVSFAVSLFTPRVRIYETRNAGRLYDFGFLLGVALLGPVSLYVGPYRLL